MNPPTTAPPGSGFRTLSPRLTFWLTFALTFVFCGLWALSSPAMSSPDEPAHAIKAAAVVRGQLLGDQRGMKVGSGLVEVPALFRQAQTLPTCYAGNAAVDASCSPALQGDLAATTTAVTSAVRYNPLYYVLAGLPSLFSDSMATFYLMRLVGALLAAWMLALVMRTLAEIGRSFWPMAAFAVALTPMTVFLCGSINPQSLELPAAMVVWVSLLSLLRVPDPALQTRRLLRLTIGTVFLANVRGLGPLMLAIIVLTVLAVSPWRPLWAILRSWRSWPFIAVCAVAVGAGVAWTLSTGTLTTSDALMYPDLTGEMVVRRTLLMSDYYVQQSLGLYGWLDTLLPTWAYLVGAGLVLFVIMVGFAAGGWRDRLGMIALGLVVLGLPVYAEYTQVRHIGLFWQGRYGLPLAVGVPLLAGFALRTRHPELPDWWSRKAVGTLLVGVSLFHTHSIAVNTRRYLNGATEETAWFTYRRDGWLPPITPWILVVGTLAGWLAFSVVILRAANRSAPSDQEIPTVLDVPPELRATIN